MDTKEALIFFGNSGSGKSTLLTLVGGTTFTAGTSFMEGLTKEIQEEEVYINNTRVLLMDVPGLYEHKASNIQRNADKLFTALQRPYKFKLFIVLRASNRGPTEEDMLLIHKISSSMSHHHHQVSFQLIINQIESEEVRGMYYNEMAKDNCQNLFKNANDENDEFKFDITISHVHLVLFDEAGSKDKTGELAQWIRNTVVTTPAVEVNASKFSAGKQDVSKFRAFWARVRRFFGLEF